MTLEETTELYASVLRQLLPVGGYDTSPNTEVLSKDIYAHAKLFAHADLDAKRLLNVLEGFPSELISEYEAEYGLPLKCSINAGRTLAERTEILRWIRQHRNVMNREYLEQILAIFGVTLVDVVKHYPMQCTTPCTTPVNTERLRYKVLLRLQYPMAADMSCIVENYLPGYLRIEWMIDMPWGDWTLNPGVTVNTTGLAHYTAYKTNQREYYDSYANLDLTAAIVRSLADADMQQWQAVKDACNELTNGAACTFDNVNEQIIYMSQQEYVETYPYIYKAEDSYVKPSTAYSAVNACKLYVSKFNTVFGSERSSIYSSATENRCNFKWDWGTSCKTSGICNESGWMTISKTSNPSYNPNFVTPTIFVSFATVAAKIISNASSSNQAISLLAEAYLEAVATSIFNTNPSKQFVQLSDLLSQFELNKTLRT